eukprot:4797681-Prymnesium_polylepis.1
MDHTARRVRSSPAPAATINLSGFLPRCSLCGVRAHRTKRFAADAVYNSAPFLGRHVRARRAIHQQQCSAHQPSPNMRTTGQRRALTIARCHLSIVPVGDTQRDK